MATFFLALVSFVPQAALPQEEERSESEKVYEVEDTIDVGKDDSADAKAMLEDFCYEKDKFKMQLSSGGGPYDVLLRFPSPLPSGNPVRDTVVVEWYRAVRTAGEDPAPAVLVQHILNGRLRLARSVAGGFATQGIHAFVMHMPGYGDRGREGSRGDPKLMCSRMQQAVADARRSRDAIATLPEVDGERIGIQGTSLGGFVAGMAGSIDRSFDPVLLVLAGGDLRSMFEVGERDTARIRRSILAEENGKQLLDELVRGVDPARIAHRLNPDRTWLFSASLDRVVPPENAENLARAAGLDDQHHVWMYGNHYTWAPYFPSLMKSMTALVKGEEIVFGEEWEREPDGSPSAQEDRE